MFDKSLRKGTIWTIIFFLASFAKTIILTPLMLLHWGADDFSDWAILLSARAVILFLSDGFVRYIVNQYNLFYHTDEAKAREVLSAGVSFIVVLSVILCSAMVILIWLNPYAYGLVFGIEINEIFGEFLSKMAGFCLIVYIISACMQTIQRMYAGTKEARGLIWNNLLMETVLIGVEIGLLSLLLLQGFRLVEFVLADSGLIFLISGSYLFYLWKKYPLAGMLKLSTIKSGATHFAKATQLYAGNFFEKLCTDGLVLLLSFFRFDKAAIALFATIRTIVNTPLLAQNLLLNTYTPQLQKDFSLRDNDGLQKLFAVIRLRIGLVLLAGIVVCYPLYEPVFTYWTKGEILYNRNFMTSMLLMATFNLYGLSFAFVFKGLNILPQMLGLMFFKTVLILFGFYVAQQNIEMFGWALAGAEFFISIILLPLLLQRFWQKQQLSFSFLQTYLAATPYLLAALLLYSISLKF